MDSRWIRTSNFEKSRLASGKFANNKKLGEHISAVAGIGELPFPAARRTTTKGETENCTHSIFIVTEAVQERDGIYGRKYRARARAGQFARYRSNISTRVALREIDRISRKFLAQLCSSRVFFAYSARGTYRCSRELERDASLRALIARAALCRNLLAACPSNETRRED